MEKQKKKLIYIIFIVSMGGVLTALSSIYYCLSVIQEDICYEEIPFHKGMSFTTWGSESYNSTESKNEILEMKKIGVDWVGVNIWWYQKSVSATEIYAGDWTDTPANITDFFDFIHSQGMKVFFKPMLNSEDGQWRSFIEASPKWIKEYNKFIKHCAELAENGSVELFSIGCEMGNWQVHTEDVIEVIKDIRKIYSGDLTYSANHDSFWYVEFWDKLDVIGMDAYFSFTLSYDPTLYDMIEVWNGFYDDLNKFQRRWNKPILFAELGCQNRDGCNIAPNDNKYRTDPDKKEFKMFYVSLFESKIWSAPWFKGTYWWMWDLRDIDEDDDNGFSPQLSVIKNTLDKYYSQKRNIIYPNYWLEFIMILILGGLITVISAYLVKKYDKLGASMLTEDRVLDAIGNLKSDITPEQSNIILRFVLISGTLFGVFLFWSFTYYNQAFFNILYGTLSKSFFLDESVYLVIFIFIFSLISMIILWILLQRLVYKKKTLRGLYFGVISIVCGILLFVLELFYVPNLMNETSWNYYITFQIMIILGILLTIILTYGFPHHKIEVLKREEKIKTIFKCVFGIISLGALILLGLSIFLHYYPRGPLLMIGSTIVLLVPLTLKYFSEIPQKKTLRREKKKRRWKLNQGKVLEALLCFYALSYYLGVLRYYDIHTLMNFNLTLLPNFFIPIAISIIIGIFFIFIFFIFDNKYRSGKISDRLSFKTDQKTELLNHLLILSIPFALIILFLGWILPQFDFMIALIFGGIPLVFIFTIYLIGYFDIYVNHIENEGTWKRLTIYLIFFLTLGFSANGIMIGVLYALTFVAIEDGQLIARTSFGEEFDYDAIQLIYNLQFFLAAIFIILSLLLLKYLVPRLRN